MQACRSPGGRTTGSAKHLPGTRPEARLCPALLHHASAQPGRAARTRRFTEKMRLGEAGSLSAPGPEAGSTQRRVLGNSTLLLLLCPVGKTKKKIQPPVATAHCIRVSQGIYKAAVSPGPGAGRARSTRAGSWVGTWMVPAGMPQAPPRTLALPPARPQQTLPLPGHHPHSERGTDSASTAHAQLAPVPEDATLPGSPPPHRLP